MPPPDPRQADSLKQIQQAWDQAQSQLAELRDQVEKTAALAQAKVAQNFLERDLDRAYRDLGEAVWAEVSKGRFNLPAQLGGVKKALEQVTVRIQEQNATINDLLAEGAEAAARLKNKLGVKSPVAPGHKKR